MLPRIPAGPAPFEVHVEPERDRVVLAPEGELDMATVPELEAAVTELLDAGFTAFRLDLRRLTFLDSSGLRYLLQLSAAGSAGLRLTVVPGPRVHRVFELSGTEELVPFEPVRPARSDAWLRARATSGTAPHKAGSDPA